MLGIFLLYLLIVSIHVPARGTTRKWNYIPVFSQFQSTFPQGERPEEFPSASCCLSVSIHVPARGTTRVNNSIVHVSKSFNPRSRKGNDGYPVTDNFPSTSFNPRSRKGNDQNNKLCSLAKQGFNPRSRKGNDSTERG